MKSQSQKMKVRRLNVDLSTEVNKYVEARRINISLQNRIEVLVEENWDLKEKYGIIDETNEDEEEDMDDEVEDEETVEEEEMEIEKIKRMKQTPRVSNTKYREPEVGEEDCQKCRSKMSTKKFVILI
uniref:Uncharacterized protein n=1 Tax=Meloidogyne hapla TaxID=6305 RepID=A0A1I8B2C1_MELHA